MINKHFIFTNHLRKRYQERFCNNKEYNRSELNSMIRNEIQKSKENKSIWNDSKFVLYLIETYKCINVRFLSNEDVIFVIKNNRIAVTCFPRKENRRNHLSGKRKKFRKNKEYNMEIPTKNDMKKLM